MTGRPEADNPGEVVDALLALSRVFVGLAIRTLASLDDEVTLPQLRTLVLLVSRGPLRAVDLAQELDVTPSTATRMCDRLVRKGLVARHSDPADRRSTRVTLTAAGHDLVGEVMRRRAAAIAEVAGELTIGDPADFAATVNAYVEAAGDLPQDLWRQRWTSSVYSASGGWAG
ncbi:MarR family winged helix-turn-helix transcriptional regulator [Actinoplanes aureus]|uniref:MarR family transcriptional regulator n=1 Tax=Actinoplanes aureus TaxID=2792083 RepID=A0A931CF86_9ACTN|nr:MarR family transcriptional regulator [Actinoplanes aureus]MBG0565451.1 MarR family transcriptional regulator [Actinoplanes aureus]